jgi:hypothetical protein
VVLNVGVPLHCEGGSKDLRLHRRRRLESDDVYGVYEGGRCLHLRFVFEQGLGC